VDNTCYSDTHMISPLYIALKPHILRFNISYERNKKSIYS